MKLGYLLIISFVILTGCREDPLSPHPKPFAKLSVTPETTYIDTNNIDSISFTADVAGSGVSGLNSSNIWARVNWDWTPVGDSNYWENWQSLEYLISHPPVSFFILDTSITFPVRKVVSLEVANPNGLSDTAFDTIYVINN